MRAPTFDQTHTYRMKSCVVMMFAPTPVTPVKVMCWVPSMVITVLPALTAMLTCVGKVAGGDVWCVGGEIEQILTAGRVGVEIGDDVVAEPGVEHEHVVAGAAGHGVVAQTAIQRVVASCAIQHVGTGVADHDVGQAIASAVDIGAAGQR